MAYDVGIGGGKVARVKEPKRDDFSPNLGGAVEYNLAHLVYKVMEVMGGALGAFGAGLGVQFLERIEPALVEYMTPLIDLLLGQEELPSEIRDYLTALKTPTDEAGALLLSQVGGQVTGAVSGSLISALLLPFTQALNRATRNTLPDVGSLISMHNRGIIEDDPFYYAMASLGYTDDLIGWLTKLSAPLPSVGDLVRGYIRGDISDDAFDDTLSKQRVPADVKALFLANAKRYLDAGEALRGYFRKEYDETGYKTRMAKMGYSEDEALAFLNVNRPRPGPGDLVRFALREAYRDDVAATWKYDEERPSEFDADMAEQGYTPEAAKYYWRAHWELPSPAMGFEMLHREQIEPTELETLLKLNDYPVYWREKLKNIAYHPLTRVDVRRMYGLGVLDEDAVKTAYEHLGYNTDDAELMKQFTIAYEAPEPESKVEKNRELTRSLILRAYRKGMIDDAEVKTKLEALRYTNEDIEFMLKMEDFEAAIVATPDLEGEFQSDCRKLIERAYGRRLVSRQDAERYLKEIGLTTEAIQYSLTSLDLAYSFGQVDEAIDRIGKAYISGAYDRTEAIAQLGRQNVTGELQSQVLGEWDAVRVDPDRRLTVTQYRNAMFIGLISRGEFETEMHNLGYNERDIKVYTVTGLYNAGLVDMLTADERRRLGIE